MNGAIAAKKAFVIGGVSVATYVFNYVLRNMLSVLTPFMLREDATAYTVEYIALLSSLYMAFYAAGQLFNGVLGDRFSPKAMVLLGLLGGGAVSAAFPFLPHGVLQMLCFAVLGYGLSMVRGPLMKIISENTAARHAQRICMFFSAASFAGPLIAGVFATLLQWRWAFVVAGSLTAAIGFSCFFVLSVPEKRGFPAAHAHQRNSHEKGSRAHPVGGFHGLTKRAPESVAFGGAFYNNGFQLFLFLMRLSARTARCVPTDWNTCTSTMSRITAANITRYL